MTPGQAAYDAFRKAIHTDNIQPHGLSKETTRGPTYGVEWEQAPAFVRKAWDDAARAARDV